MALVDTLDYFPATHPGHARLLAYLHSLADAVVRAQDPVYKGWYNVMDPGYETRSGNYIESSGSAMFVYGLFKALRMGYLEGEKYEGAATSGYGLLTGEFAKEDAGDGSLDWEWTVQVGSLSSNGTFEVCGFLFLNFFSLRLGVKLKGAWFADFFDAWNSITRASRCSRTISRACRPS